MAAPSLNPAERVKELQERVQFLLGADKRVAELLDVLKDTHRILAKLETVVGRFDEAAREAQAKFGDFDVGRLDRLEGAILNIERATLSLEAAMGALPKRWQARVARARHSE